MAKPFKGTINVDIRDSEPDWTPFEPPVDVSGEPYQDLEREAALMLMRE